MGWQHFFHYHPNGVAKFLNMGWQKLCLPPHLPPHILAKKHGVANILDMGWHGVADFFDMGWHGVAEFFDMG